MNTEKEIVYLNKAVTSITIFVIMVTLLFALAVSRIRHLEEKVANLHVTDSGAVSITELYAGVVEANAVNIGEDEVGIRPSISLQSLDGVPSITLHDNKSGLLNMLILSVDPDQKDPYIKVIKDPAEEGKPLSE